MRVDKCWRYRQVYGTYGTGNICICICICKFDRFVGIEGWSEAAAAVAGVNY